MKVLVIAAHPDDEALGCGGTLLRHKARGDRLSICLLGDGVSSRGQQGKVLKQALKDRGRAAAAFAGFVQAELHLIGGFKDNQFDTVPFLKIVQAVEGLVRAYQPDLVYTNHGGDLNIDHAITARAVLTALRPGCGHQVKRLLAFEVLSSTEWQSPALAESFAPNVFVDITPFLPGKLAALACYQEELKDFPFPRSREGVEHLAAFRGLQAGVKAAEAFMLIREVS
jgi:LmbE family N-acetylglucosaminyl deacetylase